MNQGYPDITAIRAYMAAEGIEEVAENNVDFIEEFLQMNWAMLNRVHWAGSLGVYAASDSTFNVRSGKYLYKGTVKTFTAGTAINPTDNDTTYIWMKDDNTIGSAIDGTGWPGTEHIKLAEIDVDSDGVITAIRDLRAQTFLNFSGLASAPVGLTDTQTLTNKTIDGDSNTVQDLPITAIKTDLANASKFLARDASGIPINGKAVPAGDVVGTSDTQTLTNKTIDGDSNTVQDLPITAIKTDLANASKFLARDASGIPINGKTVPAGDVIGTSDTQTLTNKTISAANNTLSNITGKEAKTSSADGALVVIFTAALIAGNTVQIHNANAPYKYRIVDAWSIAASADGGTWKLTDGTNDITNAVAVTATDKTINRAGTIDDAYYEIAANGSLSVVGDGSLADVVVFIMAIRVS